MYEYDESDDFEEEEKEIEESEQDESDSFSIIDYGRDFTMFHSDSAPECPDYQDLVHKYFDSEKKIKNTLSGF